MRKNAADPARFAKAQSSSGKFSFTLTSSNKQVIGNSQSYSSESGRNNGITSIGKAAAELR